MGDIHGTRTAEEFIPHSNWSEDLMGHYLSVHLPGFKNEEVMVALACPGYVTISGERKVNDDRCIYFGQALQLPENLDMNKIGQNFEDEILCLTFPKRVEENNENDNPATEENAQEELINDENQIKHDGHGEAENEEQSKKTDGDHVVSVHKEIRTKGSKLERGINLLKNNMILAVVLAFALGVFVSRRFESNGQ
ncbi:15.4 kDa class V heat shock protein-like [Durio zibethinus]|uniref:15.4 kDa class V heat shock protein-like n=1 Tax=Durio zibethinus TaxID=66656 RepID=A0A6P5WID5_DURZI|nr:15.4 kDa class V heat shock protein-like [Durio zibethinus]